MLLNTNYKIIRNRQVDRQTDRQTRSRGIAHTANYIQKKQ